MKSHKLQHQQPHQQIFESLRSKDMEHFINTKFSIDRFKSKMGEDEDIVVLGFKLKEKQPAIDLMEFFEKSYDFILDSDMSAGEEFDGNYHVFVELERNKNLPNNLNELFYGLKKLTNNSNWKFSYQKSKEYYDLNEDNLKKYVPLNVDSYKKFMFESKSNDIKKFFNKGIVDVILSENNTLIFKKPYFHDLTAKFIAIGKSDKVFDTTPGPFDITESGQSKVLFLNKFLGNYDIQKIGDKYIIRNEKDAIIIEKDRW
jgi:hypothetical protein